MRTGILLTVSSIDRQHLGALIRDRSGKNQLATSKVGTGPTLSYTYDAAGGGLGEAADVSGGVSAAYSPNLCSIYDLNGPFGNVDLGGGWGPHATGDAFYGQGVNAQFVTGAGITLGAGLGEGGASTITTTAVTIGHVW